MRRLSCLAALLLLGGMLFGRLAHARGTCTIEGRAVQPFTVEIKPKEAAPFKLSVSGVAAAITPGGIGAPAAAHVKAPLEFDGWVAAETVPARTRRATDALNGLLRLAPAMEKLLLHANVRAKIVDAEAKIGGVTFRGLALPCDALTLDSVPEPEARPLKDYPDAQRLVAAGKLLHVRGEPNGGSAMEVALEDPGELELRQTEASGAWLHVTNQWPDGTLLIGWIRRDELTPAGTHHEPLGELSGVGLGCGGKLPVKAGQRIAVADITPGTTVYAARYLGAWAKIVDGKALTVRYSGKDDWIELVKIPNLAGVSPDDACPRALDSAWIPRAAAALPAESAVPVEGGAK